MTARDGQAGVTLVEVMITLSIIGVLAGMSLLAFGPGGRGAAAEFAAERLAADLNAAVLDSLATGSVAAVETDRDGYRISSWDASREIDLPSGVRLEAETREALDILPDGTGQGAAWTISGARTPWVVRFDGLTARAAPVEG